MAYNVYLFNALGALSDQNTIGSIKTTLQAYFTKVATKANVSGGASVTWVITVPPIKDNELLLYFLPSGNSVLSVQAGKALSSPAAFGDNDGATSGGTPKASEVYVRTNDAKVLSNLAFHEAMHNKLQLDNKQLHNGDGLRGTLFKSNADIGGDVSGKALSQKNIDDMATALSKSVPQWTRGITALILSATRKASGDPLWDN